MEKSNWTDKMDALEAIWRIKMAETRDEYQQVREMLHKKRLVPEYRASTFDRRNS